MSSSLRMPPVVVRTGAALLVLWSLSFGASYLDLGAAALPFAIAVAAVKAGLVVVFFMELLRESLSMKLPFLAAGTLLAIFIGLVVADIVTRETPPLAPDGTAAER